MKIAVTYENGMVFQHFGHSQAFRVYDVQDGKIITAETVPTQGSGHGALAGFLAAQGVDTLICGGIGAGAGTGGHPAVPRRTGPGGRGGEVPACRHAGL